LESSHTSFIFCPSVSTLVGFTFVSSAGFIKAEPTGNVRVDLIDPESSANIVNPAIVIFEEKDDNSNYEAQIITLESGATSDDGIGVSDAIRTWGSDNVWEAITLASDSKMQKGNP